MVEDGVFKFMSKMKIKTIAIAIFMALTLWSCQSDSPQEIQSNEKVLSVKASLPGSEASRAIIEYGNYEDSTREILSWVQSLQYNGRDEDDYIKLFNITRFEETHYTNGTTPYLFITDISGKTATFESFTKYPKFPVKTGDILLAVQGFADPANKDDVAEGSTNVISYQAGSTLYDQKIVDNPTTSTALGHMFFMLHMYDIVKVEEDDVIPDLHFKHFNAIIRVTLQNQTGKPLFTGASDMVFTTSSKDMSAFIYGFNYFSVVGNDTDGFYLQENFKVPPPRHPLNPTKPAKTTVLSHKTTHKINYMGDNKIPLNDGETYEFYAVVTPRIGNRIGNTETIDKFTIDVFDSGSESGYYSNDSITKPDRYTITIDNFNTAIEPGKRYWFNLTATKEAVKVETNIYDDNDKVTGTKELEAYRLMFTSEWNATHNNGGNTSTN